MKILIDLQPCQGESSFRGIGRYSMSLAKAIARNRKDHEIYLLLNGAFIDTVERIKKEFKDLLPEKNIITFFIPTPVAQINPENIWRSKVAELIREYAIFQINPDIVHISSLFEGFGDDIVTSIGQFSNDIPTSVTLYDLIPLIHKETLLCHPNYKEYYLKKIEYLKKANLLLSISESSKKEAIKYLDIENHKIVNMSAAIDEKFRKISISNDLKDKIFHKYNIKKPFILYAPGGFDPRKNIDSLIDAFSKLPKGIKENYQLVITSKIPDGNKKDLEDKIEKTGLTKNDIVITGYVPDDELIAMYNLCELFIFPSLHEGFGLPALEAMACGAPVIGSNTTSIPEVIGREDALFDPYSVESIASKMKEVLTNDNFRNELREYAIKRSKEFSWDKSAKIAIEAFEKFDDNKKELCDTQVYVENTTVFNKQKKKILAIKLEHRGDLILAIPAFSKLKARYPYSSIDLICGSFNKEIAESLKIFNNIYTIDFFKPNSSEPPGLSDEELNILLKKLDQYDIAIDFRRPPDSRFLLTKINSKLKVGYKTFDQKIDEKIDICLDTDLDTPYKKISNNMKSVAIQMIELVDSIPHDINDFIYYPELHAHNSNLQDKLKSIAVFPKAGNDVREWHKNNFISLINLLEKDPRIDFINIYFGNEKESQDFKDLVGKKIRIYVRLRFQDLVESVASNAICITNNSFGAHLASYLSLVTIAVFSGHETPYEWGPCFGNGYVLHVNADCSPCHLPNKDLCMNNMFCLENIKPNLVYDKIDEALRFLSDHSFSKKQNIISIHNPPERNIERLMSAISKIVKDISDKELISISNIISMNVKNDSNKQLLIDVSEISRVDAKSGIQRVVRAQLVELLNSPPDGFRVEPIYLSDEGGYWHYRYARKFTSNILRLENVNLEDEAIDFYEGDIFYAPDLHPLVIEANKAGLYKKMRAKNVSINFLVYDILPILRPDCFPEGAKNVHSQWVDAISSVADRLICISNSVAEELKSYLTANGKFREDLQITYIHLGADIERSVPTKGMPQDYEKFLDLLRSKPSFLMVGTIEPRKGHLQTIKAFDILWKNGHDVNLVIVGKQGWMVESLIKLINHHPELHNRLFWLSGISDEYLEKIYESSSCFIMASEGEGFGLPLIEAAKHKLPIIARDISVYKEVASDYAYYFTNDTNPQTLAKAIEQWLNLYKENKHPKSEGMKCLTWKENVKRLLDVIFEGE